MLQGAGATFDFTALADNKVQSIEAIDFTGSGNNTLTLGLTDALNLSEVPNFDFTGLGPAPKALVIDGNPGDTLQLGADARGAWTHVDSDVNLDGTAGGLYDVWTFDAGATDFIKLAVNTDVGVWSCSDACGTHCERGAGRGLLSACAHEPHYSADPA